MVEFIGWARIIRERGMRDLEAQISRNGRLDPFLKYGLNMVVSDYTPKEVRSMTTAAADSCYEREYVPVDILQDMASHAPAFGMMGTLIGMVMMLYKVDANVSSVGSSLAISFLSTLYGVVSARLLYIPAASKLLQEVEGRRFRNQFVIEGLVMLVKRKTPMYMQDSLNAFLHPEIHDYFIAEVENHPITLNPSNSHQRKTTSSAKPRLRAVGT